jgi:hypothetical protein
LVVQGGIQTCSSSFLLGGLDRFDLLVQVGWDLGRGNATPFFFFVCDSRPVPSLDVYRIIIIIIIIELMLGGKKG